MIFCCSYFCVSFWAHGEEEQREYEKNFSKEVKNAADDPIEFTHPDMGWKVKVIGTNDGLQ